MRWCFCRCLSRLSGLTVVFQHLVSHGVTLAFTSCQFEQAQYQAAVLDCGFADFEASGRQFDATLEAPVRDLDASYAGRFGGGHGALADRYQRALVDQHLQMLGRHARQGDKDRQLVLGLEDIGRRFPGRPAVSGLTEPKELPVQPVCLLKHAQGIDPYRAVWLSKCHGCFLVIQQSRNAAWQYPWTGAPWSFLPGAAGRPDARERSSNIAACDKGYMSAS